MEVPMQPLLDKLDEWTFDDLDQLDTEEWRRYEIVDGTLVVSPSASFRHEYVIARLRNAVQRVCPAGLEVLNGNLGVVFGRSYRVPDLMVVPAEPDLDQRWFRPCDVRLAVEVVSPSSLTTDRITKTAQYAAAGIAHYWRVETDLVSLTAYSLGPGSDVYTEVGTWTDVAPIEAPFPVEIELSHLVA